MKLRYLDIDIDYTSEVMRKRIIINLTDQQIKELERIAKSKDYKSRSEAIRDAVVQFLEKKKIEEIEKKLHS